MKAVMAVFRVHFERGIFMFRRNIYIMYIIALLQGMVFYGPIATLYRQAEGVSILEITIIESISLALCLLFELPWGVIADKIGYRRTMLICCGLYFVSKIIFWQATGFFGFLLERCLLSVVIAGLSGVDTSVLYLSCEKDKSQHVFGIYEGLGTAGLLFAAFIYSIAVGTNYKLAGFLTMISYGIAFVLAFFLQEVKAEEEINASTGEFISLLKETLANKYLLLFLIGIAVFNETHQTITVFLNQLQYVRAGISEVSMGYIYIAVTVIGLCGVFSAKVTDKIGKIELMRICYMAAILACISLAATNRAWLSVGGIIILRITFSLAQPLQTELQNEQITTVNRATALSINAVIIDSIGICTNVVFGALAKTNLILAFVFGAVLCTAGLVWFEVWRRGTKKI